MYQFLPLRRACVASILSFAIGASASGCSGGNSSVTPHDRSTRAIPICGADNPDCGSGGGGGTRGATPINDTLVDADNNSEHITWSGLSSEPTNGVVQLAGGGTGSSASAMVPSSTATSMTETVNAPGLGTYQIPIPLDVGTPPATETYPNGMTVTEDSTNGTATGTQTDARGVTWTVHASVNSDGTWGTIVATSTAGESFTKQVPLNGDMTVAPMAKGRAVQSVVRATRALSEAEQSQLARGICIVAMGVLVLGSAPFAAAAIGIAMGVGMIVQAARHKP